MERPALFDDAPPEQQQPQPAPVAKRTPHMRLDTRVARRREPLVIQRGVGSVETGKVIGSYEVYKLARMGCTREEAAQFFGMSGTSFGSRLHREFELKLAWDRGSAQAKIGLRRLQMRHAEEPGDAGVKMTIHMSKHQLGEVEVQRIQHGGAGEDNPIRVKVEREELIGRIVGNRTIEAGSDSSD